MLADLKLECNEILEDYPGVVVLGNKSLGTAGPFLTVIDTPGGRVQVYHELGNREFTLAKVVGIETITNMGTRIFRRAFPFFTGEPSLDPAYTIPPDGFGPPLGELLGFRPDLAIAERLGVHCIRGKHEAMITGRIIPTLKRDLNLR